MYSGTILALTSTLPYRTNPAPTAYYQSGGNEPVAIPLNRAKRRAEQAAVRQSERRRPRN